jgi:N utilization substance protein B
MKGSRRLSRELALQGLYQWLVNQTDADEVLAQISDKEGFAKADQAYLESLVRGVVNEVGSSRRWNMRCC